MIVVLSKKSKEDYLHQSFWLKFKSIICIYIYFYMK